MRTFDGLFNFNADNAWCLGVERECFVVENGLIVPKAPAVLQTLNGNHPQFRFGYELSACQVETQIGPVLPDQLLSVLQANDLVLRSVLDSMGLVCSFKEIASDDMPLDIYPDPTGRYAEISQRMSREVLLAACQIIGTHIHIGMPDAETALAVYNYAVDYCQRLIEMSTPTTPNRLAIYKIVSPDNWPRKYESWDDFYQHAVKAGFENDPRQNWQLIRISVHGTIEFRLFGATDNVKLINSWANHCHDLCKAVLVG